MNLQVLGIIVGLLAGLIWEILVNTPYKSFLTLFPSQYLTGNKIHLHHWIWYVVIFLVIIVWSIRADKSFHPAVLMIESFILTALIYGFLKFPGWTSFS
jgi:hypothetical protein